MMVMMMMISDMEADNGSDAEYDDADYREDDNDERGHAWR